MRISVGQITRKLRSLSVRASFVIYALLALVVALLICSILINLLERKTMNIYFKYSSMSRIYDVPENGFVEITYMDEGAVYDIYNEDGLQVNTFTASYHERVETVFDPENPDEIECLSVLPVYSEEDETLETLLEILQILTIPVVFCGSMIACAFLFYRRKLKKPIELLEAAYRKVAENDLDFVLRYDSMDEMGKLCEAFEKMRRSLSENNREMWRQMEERKRLNAAFSHDLRTPLTVLKGHASMLLSSLPQHSLPQEEVIGEVRTMAAHITRLEKYVEAMTQLQRLEDIEIRREAVDAAELIGALQETAGILCGDKTLLSYDTVEGGSFRLDEEAVSQVFENLLSNAVRYAEQKIEITFRTSAQFFCIEVSDDGAGFSCAGLEQATAPFYREKQEFGDSHMGIGLNICKILCIKHGGYLSVANRKEGGACVTAVFAV